MESTETTKTTGVVVVDVVIVIVVIVVVVLVVVVIAIIVVVVIHPGISIRGFIQHSVRRIGHTFVPKNTLKGRLVLYIGTLALRTKIMAALQWFWFTYQVR